MAERLIDRVKIIEGERYSDERGWLHVALRRSMLPEEAKLGELYVVQSEAPMTRRGDHYHLRANEWFTVVSGHARFECLDPSSGERRHISCDSASPQTVFIPAGLGHAILNLGPGPLTVVAWADAPHDPADVVPCDCSE